jgi:hypothetical protein
MGTERKAGEVDIEQLRTHLSVLALREAVRYWLKTGELTGPLRRQNVKQVS